MSGPRPDGPARLLAVVYGIFALSAGARSLFQIASDFGAAPLAYSLSGLAAGVYLLAAACFWRPSARSWGLAVAALIIEFVGVIAVGALSLASSELFPEATVWSEFGRGYGFVPLVLPVLGLAWLARPGTRAAFDAER